MLNFLDEFRVKEALLQCASMYESRNTSQIGDFDIGFYKQPFLTVEWVVPPVQLRPMLEKSAFLAENPIHRR